MVAKKPRKKKSKIDSAVFFVDHDTEVVMPSGKTKLLKTGVPYSNLPPSILNQLED